MKTKFLALLLLVSAFAIGQGQKYRVGIQDYNSVVNLRNETMSPRSADKVFIQTTKHLYSYDSSDNTSTDDGLNTIVQAAGSKRWKCLNCHLHTELAQDSIIMQYDANNILVSRDTIRPTIPSISLGQRPFIKVGNATETSATDVVSSDNVYHEGKVMLGTNGVPLSDLHIKKAANGATEIITENTNVGPADYSDNVILNGDVKTTIGSYKAGGFGYTGTESNNDFYIYSNNTTAFVMKPDGKVGIGTTTAVASPTNSLMIGNLTGSGLSFQSLNSTTTPTAGAQPIGVSSSGEVVAVSTTSTDQAAGTSNTAGNNVGINTSTPIYTLDVNAVDGIRIPAGTTAERPANQQEAVFRFNKTTKKFEGFNGTVWVDFN